MAKAKTTAKAKKPAAAKPAAKAGVPKEVEYYVTEKSFINCTIVEPGTKVMYAGRPGSNLSLVAPEDESE